MIASAIPFENRKIQGFWNSYIQNWKEAALEPNRFYSELGNGRDMESAIYFYLLNAAIGMAFGFFLKLPLAMMFAPLSGSIFLFSSIFFFPFIMVFCLGWLFIGAGITHLFLLLFGGGRGGYSTTLRTYAYSTGPAIIPVVGWLWQLVLLVIGLAAAHRCEMWCSIAAIALEVFIGLALVCLCLASVFLTLFHLAPVN